MIDFLNTISGFIWGKVLIYTLIPLGIYFTIRLKFFQFRNPIEMIKVATERKTTEDGISSFKAFAIAAASRIGTGNLAGVALAVSIGGPGAIFWMWAVATFGAASAFVESTLAQIYKVKDSSDTNRCIGGPAYYIEQGLGSKTLSIIFVFAIVFAYSFAFNSIQSNTIASALEHAFHVDKSMVGIAVTVVVAIILYGNSSDKIGNISAIVVPFMSTLYVGIALYVLVVEYDKIIPMLTIIIDDAFGGQQVIGGVAGGAMQVAMMQGIKRGLFSNEAGMGSAPNAAASAHVSHPAKQGLMQALGVFLDTMLICSITGFLILSSGAVESSPDASGIVLTQIAISTYFGETMGNDFIAILVICFAGTSILGNFFLGEANVKYITKNKNILTLHKILVCVILYVGSISSLGTVWDMGDLAMGIMAIINLYAIAILFKYALAAWEDFQQQKSMGKDPVFKKSTVEGLEKVEYWG